VVDSEFKLLLARAGNVIAFCSGLTARTARGVTRAGQWRGHLRFRLFLYAMSLKYVSSIRKLKIRLLGGARARHVRPSHKMQRTFMNLRKSVDLVSTRALNNQARYNEVDFTRLKANVSNTGRVVRDMTILACEA